MHRKLIIASIFSLLIFSCCFSQQQILYKQIDTTNLFMEVYQPEKMDSTKIYPAMVFFFGGGWKSGNTSQFINHAKYFSHRGIVCFLVDYRTENKNKTSPFEALKDAKSAIRYIRKNAKKLHVDPAQIIASGGSAGGHLAAATALIDRYNENSDDLIINCIPNALILYNPVIDNGPGGYGYERIGEAYKDFSPLHNIQKSAPATILFLGTDDTLIPVQTAAYYKIVMEKVKSRCDLKLYQGQGHGFFNYKNFDYYKKTVTEADKFLQSIGYLSEKSILEID